MDDYSPTGAHQALLALLSRVLLEVARRRQDELPGLVETLQDDVVVTTGGTRRRVLGTFTEEIWRYDNRQVHEVFLNADRRDRYPGVSAAEDVLTTLLHEGCHVWAKANGVRDTSRDGRWHNRRFAEVALQIGLDVERDPVIGHQTPGLSVRGRTEYFDLLAELEQGLLLSREPQRQEPESDDEELTGQESPAAMTTSQQAAKYIFASCACRDGRGRKVTIRVAKGSWRPGVIRCEICQSPFQES
jgi:hypothetical protein